MFLSHVSNSLSICIASSMVTVCEKEELCLLLLKEKKEKFYREACGVPETFVDHSNLFDAQECSKLILSEFLKRSESHEKTIKMKGK